MPGNDTHIGILTNKCDFHSDGGHPPTANGLRYSKYIAEFGINSPQNPRNDTHIDALAGVFNFECMPADGPPAGTRRISNYVEHCNKSSDSLEKVN